MNALLTGPNSPMIARIAPFFIFLILTSLQGVGPEATKYWMYGAKAAIGAFLLWLVYPHVREMRWNFSLAGLAVGIAVAVLWIGLDPFYKHYGRSGAQWNPHNQFGDGSLLAWSFIAIRLLCVTLIVPPLEELFYRSFMYRYIAKPDFESVPLQGVRWMPFLVTSAIFGFAHSEWLAGILCGMAYQGLVCWKGRLGDATFAHAVTNLLLSAYVVARGQWQFW